MCKITWLKAIFLLLKVSWLWQPSWIDSKHWSVVDVHPLITSWKFHEIVFSGSWSILQTDKLSKHHHSPPCWGFIQLTHWRQVTSARILSVRHHQEESAEKTAAFYNIQWNFQQPSAHSWLYFEGGWAAAHLCERGSVFSSDLNHRNHMCSPHMWP